MAHSRQRVQCDRLKTNEVVSAGNRRRNRSRPGRVLVNHLPAAPISVEDSPANKSGLIDFELILGQELVIKMSRGTRTHLSVFALTPVHVDPGHWAKYVSWHDSQ